jgi:NAD+ diphosphatase
MAVRHRNRLLLARQSSWAQGLYSALAGFVEPGESLEEAVAREVFEESGVRVAGVRYVASQPWPFPSSLMIGMQAEAKSDVLQVDASELEDARWFNKTELLMMLDRKHPEGFTASNPYAIAHHLVRIAIQDL